MAGPNAQLSQVPSYTDFAFKNNTGATLAANIAVAIDATYSTTATALLTSIGIKEPASTGDPVIGVLMESVADGAVGKVRCLGPIAQMFADGAITAGTYVDGSAASSKKGFAKAHTAAKASIGIALTGAAADGDSLLVMLVGGFNA